jgi:hypothetical protein
MERRTLECAREAEPLLRERLEMCFKDTPERWRASYTRSLLGEAIVLEAELDSGLTPEARGARLREAEPLLVESYASIDEHPPVPNPLGGGADPVWLRRTALGHVVHLYEVRGKTEPGKGYDAKAAEWKAKLPSAPAGTGKK